MPDQVPNPKHSYLTSLLHQVRQVQAQIRGKLTAPAQNMAGGKVWSSPTAKTFSQALSFETTKYDKAVEALAGNVQVELNRTPAQCTKAEADAWRSLSRAR